MKRLPLALTILLAVLAAACTPRGEGTPEPIVITATPPPGSETQTPGVTPEPGGATATATAAPPTPTTTAAPPTPTATPAPALAKVVFVHNGNLFVSTLSESGGALSAAPPLPLTQNGSVTSVAVSPDGQWAAYKREPAFGQNELHVVAFDGSTDNLLVNSADLPSLPGVDPQEIGRIVGEIGWLPNSSAVAFNTTELNLVGPGAGSVEDFWIVDVSAQAQEVLAPGQGGGRFSIAPDGSSVVMSASDEIIRANIDGTGREVVVTFPQINTASEYIYYPVPQWTVDSVHAYLAIPSATPWEVGANAALWRVPAAGPAEQLNDLPGNILFNPVLWTGDASHLGYAKFLIDPAGSPPNELVVASGDGSSPATVDSGSQLQFHGWSENGQHFAYSSDALYGVAALGAAPVTNSLSGQARVGQNGEWVGNAAIVLPIGTFGSWDLYAVDASGSSTLLLTMTADLPILDVWVP